jgi:hypothetical protein
MLLFFSLGRTELVIFLFLFGIPALVFKLLKLARGASKHSVSTHNRAPLPLSKRWTQIALQLPFFVFCAAALGDVVLIVWFYLYPRPSFLFIEGYLILTRYVEAPALILPELFVFKLFPPVAFIILLCLGGLVVYLSEAVKLHSHPEQSQRSKPWFLASLGLAVLLLFFIFQPLNLEIFGAGLIVYENLLFLLSLVAINRLARWLVFKKPEDAVYVTKPFALFLAGYLSLVSIAWLLQGLNIIGPLLMANVFLFGGMAQSGEDAIRWIVCLVCLPCLIYHIVFFIYLAILAHHRRAHELADVAQSPTHVLGAIKMKVFNHGKFMEEEEQPAEQSLVRTEQNSFSALAKYADQPPSSFGLVDGLKSKVGSNIQKRILEDQTKVTEAHAKAMEAQKKVLEQKVGLIETATKGQRARNEYELLPEERQIKEMGYQVNRSELELQKMKLEMEKKKLEQMMNGTYAPEPEGLAEVRAAREKVKHENRQTYIAVAEEDSVTARCQALDDWYDEKQAEIMGNQRLDVARRRQQLDMLDKEYKLRKKLLDDHINELLGAQEGSSLHV